MRQGVAVAVALHVEAHEAGGVDEGVVLLEGDGGRTAGSAHGEVGLAAGLGALQLPWVAAGDMILELLLAPSVASEAQPASVAEELRSATLRGPEGRLRLPTHEAVEVGHEDVVPLPQEQDDFLSVQAVRLAEHQRVGAHQRAVVEVLLPLVDVHAEVVLLLEGGDLSVDVVAVVEHAQVQAALDGHHLRRPLAAH